jgi:hypothetical protein
MGGSRRQTSNPRRVAAARKMILKSGSLTLIQLRFRIEFTNLNQPGPSGYLGVLGL